MKKKKITLVVIIVVIALVVLIGILILLGNKEVVRDESEDNESGSQVSHADVTEEDIILCEEDNDCVIVAYEHCCGATKRAINKNYLSAYNSHVEWQSFNEEDICAVIGACADDSYISSAYCEEGYCQLKFPLS